MKTSKIQNFKNPLDKPQPKDLKFKNKKDIIIPAGTEFIWSGVQITYYQSHYTAIYGFDKDNIADITISKKLIETHPELFEEIK